jgi:hypothetical protein
VDALTEQQVRRSLINCMLGWRDPKAPLRGCLVVETDDGPVGIAVRAAESRMSSRTSAMCLLCQTTQSGDAVSLFTARRTGAAGRNGNTVGTYMCADLACSRRVRTEIPPWSVDRDPAEVVTERAGELRERVTGFVDAVRR